MSALEAWRADPAIAEVIAEVPGDIRGPPFPELHYAVQTGRADIVAELLADGADVNKRLDYDRAPLPPIQIMPGLGICITAEITKMLLAAQADERGHNALQQQTVRDPKYNNNNKNNNNNNKKNYLYLAATGFMTSHRCQPGRGQRLLYPDHRRR
ncbi:unnamed protein product [Polarella glacialis]|nr:unnamed protein product [Polarella glacialis]